MCLNLLDRLGIDERAHGHALVGSVSEFQLFDCRRQLLCEGIIDARLHQYTVGADTGLPGIAELRSHGSRHRPIEIGIIENDKRRIAAELHTDALHGSGGLAHEELANLCGAGEGHHAHQRIGRHFSTDWGRIGRRHNVENALGDARTLRELGKSKG